MGKQLRSFLVFSFLVFIAVCGVILGAVSSKGILVFAKERYTDLQSFSKVLNLVQQYYVEEVDVNKLIQGAIKGMLNELDPHTNFMPQEVFSEFENETSGEFGGLGIEISVQNEILTIISPIEDTPAFKAGIKAGDKVISVDSKSTKGLNLVEAAQLIKGKIGSSVDLGIMREGFEKPKIFRIKRDTVKIRSVKYTDMEDAYAYIRLTSFIENSSDDMKKEIDKHIKKNKEVKGLILDVRNNPGGLLKQAVEIADFFLTKGSIVSTIGRNKKDQEVLYAKADGTYPNFPIVILLNEYSASASEILAGALQDHNRALVMGERSYGKGSVQSVVKLGDGSGLKLTVARYYTPKGVSIQGLGIKPDVPLENISPEAFSKSIVRKQSRREKDVEGHLVGENEVKSESKSKDEDSLASDALFNDIWSVKDESKLSARDKLLKNDYQILQAYKYLRAWKLFNKSQSTEL